MISFTIWITEKCNLACKYCYEQSFFEDGRCDGTYNEAVVSFIKNIADYYPDDDIIISFHGGEPLLGFDVIKKYVRKLKFIFRERVQFSITTNGTLIDSEIADYLVRYFSNISISLDGIKTINDKNRVNNAGCGTYDVVMNNLLMLPVRKNALRIRMTLTAEAVDYFYDSIVDLVSKGYTFMAPVIAVNDAGWDDSKIDKLFLQIQKLVDNGYGYLPFIKRLCEEPRVLSQCNGGIKSFNVSIKGKIYPCEYVIGNDGFCLGDIQDGISIIDNGKKYISIYNKKNEGACEECSYSAYCDAVRCKYYNYVNNGDLLEPSDNQCRVERLNYRIWREFGCQK